MNILFGVAILMALISILVSNYFYLVKVQSIKNDFVASVFGLLAAALPLIALSIEYFALNTPALANHFMISIDLLIVSIAIVGTIELKMPKKFYIMGSIVFYVATLVSLWLTFKPLF